MINSFVGATVAILLPFIVIGCLVVIASNPASLAAVFALLFLLGLLSGT